MLCGAIGDITIANPSVSTSTCIVRVKTRRAVPIARVESMPNVAGCVLIRSGTPASVRASYRVSRRKTTSDWLDGSCSAAIARSASGVITNITDDDWVVLPRRHQRFIGPTLDRRRCHSRNTWQRASYWAGVYGSRYPSRTERARFLYPERRISRQIVNRR